MHVAAATVSRELNEMNFCAHISRFPLFFLGNRWSGKMLQLKERKSRCRIHSNFKESLLVTYSRLVALSCQLM